MKIYFAGESYSHLEKNMYRIGVRNRLFSYYYKSEMKLALKKLDIKLKDNNENKK